MQIQPYLFFEGRCEEAIDYYRNTLGAEVEALMRFSEAPQPPEGAEPSEGCAGPMPAGDKIMHACFRVGDTRVMASDGMCSGNTSFQGVSLALTVPDDDAAERLFGALANGGQVQQPLIPTFFASRFGVVADQFGVSWMVVTDGTPN